MSAFPRIAIPVPTTADAEYNARSWPQYATAVEEAGGQPVRLEIALAPAEIADLAATCDGILLPGSPADVDPSRFAAERDPATSPADPNREAADFALLDHAARTRKPVLAICYGCQSLNVWRGGSLVQDLTPLPVNHSAGRSVAIAHSAIIARDSLLGSLTDPAEAPEVPDSPFRRLPVNTSHHQAVAAPGEGLRIVARCPEDGVIEAIEAAPSPDAPMLLGVQWHPERSTAISATSRNLFTRLIQEASHRPR
jgi:putative glutamine amidotransferase